MSKKIANLSKSTLVVIIVCSVIVLIGAATGITYAVWSASVSKEVGVKTGDWFNPSEKYLILEVEQGGNKFPFIVDQDTIVDNTNGKSIKPTFIPYSAYQTADNGYRTDVSFNKGVAISSVCVIGYVGNVNEIIIPDAVNIGIDNDPQNVTANVTAIDIDNQEFEGIRIVTSLTIGANVNSISAFTFSNCTYLSSIVFTAETATEVSIGDYAFYNCPLMSATNVTKGSVTLSLGTMAGENPNTNTNFLK